MCAAGRISRTVASGDSSMAYRGTLRSIHSLPATGNCSPPNPPLHPTDGRFGRGTLDLRRLALLATILHGDRPMLVISPPTPDLQIAQREPFPTEAGPTHQREGPLVAGLDARLHAMEPQVSEGVLEDELEPFPHEPLPGEGLEG